MDSLAVQKQTGIRGITVPSWTSHSEGGSWYGGGTSVPNCSLEIRDRITAEWNRIISDPCLDGFPGLKDCLRAKWQTIEIDCPSASDCEGLDGFQSGNRISLCNTSADRLGPVLLHEMVHACDGTELDSEAIQNLCYDGDGATLPTSGDWDKFKSESEPVNGDENVRAGKYVIWDSTTGEIFERAEATINREVPPDDVPFPTISSYYCRFLLHHGEHDKALERAQRAFDWREKKPGKLPST